MCWNKGRLCWKIAKLFYFCHLKKLVRPETFGPYYVPQQPSQIFARLHSIKLQKNVKLIFKSHFYWCSATNTSFKNTVNLLQKWKKQTVISTSLNESSTLGSDTASFRKKLLTFRNCSAFVSDCLTLKMKTLCHIKMAGITHTTMQFHIQEDLNLHQYCCENPKSSIHLLYFNLYEPCVLYMGWA